MPNNSKIRSACDACHRMKVRCTGDVPCEGCLNSRNLCFYSYSGRLGRPKGTKNRKRKPDEEGASPTSSEREKGPRSQSPQGPLPQQSTEHFEPQQKLQSHPATPTFSMADCYPTGMSSASSTILDPMMDTNAFTMHGTKSQSQSSLDKGQFDFSDFFNAEADTQSFLDPSLKVCHARSL